MTESFANKDINFQTHVVIGMSVSGKSTGLCETKQTNLEKLLFKVGQKQDRLS